MKLNTASNEAILSNVSELGEFRIRNSAKAFSILSSGLYANKVRAIIRELSCNAVDSHVAANKSDVPFEVHLPNAIEPYFSVRDFGVGLNHDEVTNIYTTYFESTKTGSDDYIGALGLGSKSPFSYTENFTVTAIKNGRRGIYTAFINSVGVPSIALMMEEETTDGNGVEVRFAVTDSSDYQKFSTEARAVYEHFALRPVVVGNKYFSFADPAYTEKNVIPSVHYLPSHESFAIMGNIKYKIDIPNADSSFGAINELLKCGLVMEFKIGELDIQASREGLSYIPQTVDAIKGKLEKLNNELTRLITVKADAIPNLWDRAMFLASQYNYSLWKSAVLKYIADTKFELWVKPQTYTSPTFKEFKLSPDTLAKQYNIVIRSFRKDRNSSRCHIEKPYFDSNIKEKVFTIRASNESIFVINDTNVGALERTKYHWRNAPRKVTVYTERVYVIEAADRKLPVNTKKFFNDLQSPPDAQILLVSTLKDRDRKVSTNGGRNVTVMVLGERYNHSHNYYDHDSDFYWESITDDVTKFDSKQTYFYIPMCGYKGVGEIEDVKQLYAKLKLSSLVSNKLYGVRKGDLEYIKKQPNWVNINDHMKGILKTTTNEVMLGLVKNSLDWNRIYGYNSVKMIKNQKSPYVTLFNELHNIKTKDSVVESALNWLLKVYGITLNNVSLSTLQQQYQGKVKALKTRYPFLGKVSSYDVTEQEFSEYINMCDDIKGV